MDCVDAGNVLVHLFLQTNTRYVLTNKKLQYLLIIAQLSRLSQNELLFDDDIRNFRQSLVIDTIGNNFVSDSEIVSGIANDKSICCDTSNFVLPYSKKKIYEIVQMPSEEDRNLLVSVFLRFGAYHESTLCRLLCDFKPLRNAPAFSVISKEKISSFFSGVVSGNQYARNPIFNFVKTQRLEADKAAGPLKTISAQSEEVSALPASPEPQVEPILALKETPKPIVVRQPKAALKDVPSLQNVVAGKQYSILVELLSPSYDCQVSVLALSSNKYLNVARKRLTDTLYRFTFVGVASDIKISTNITG